MTVNPNRTNLERLYLNGDYLGLLEYACQLADALAAAHRHIDEMAVKYAAQSRALTQAAERRTPTP